MDIICDDLDDSEYQSTRSDYASDARNSIQLYNSMLSDAVKLPALRHFVFEVSGAGAALETFLHPELYQTTVWEDLDRCFTRLPSLQTVCYILLELEAFPEVNPEKLKGDVESFFKEHTGRMWNKGLLYGVFTQEEYDNVNSKLE